MKKEDIIKRIPSIVNSTALSSSNHYFMATHMPFKKLKYSRVLKSQQPTIDITEEDFFREKLMMERNQHKMIFVKGNAGSGKSNLIRWFYLKYKLNIDPKEELAILIPRASNSLKGTLNEIVSSEMFEGFQDDLDFKKIIEAGESLDKENLREEIPAMLSASIRNSEDIRSSRDKKRISNFIISDIVREKILFIDSGPIERIISGLVGSEKEYKKDNKFYASDFDLIDLDFISEMRSSEGDFGASRPAIATAEDMLVKEGEKQRIVDILNSHLDDTVKRVLHLGRTDLIEVFKKIRMKLKEENMALTIFFEDITTSSGIHKEILESLIMNHTETDELCRIISFVGITNGYYDKYIPDNIKERATDGIDIGEGSLIENKNDLSTFIGLYLNAINQPEESIKDWYLESGDINKLPITNNYIDKEWSVVNVLDNKEISLYPFTESCLWNIYEGFKVDKREPRGLLNFIIKELYMNFILDGEDYILDMDVYNNIDISNLRDILDETTILNSVNGDEKVSKKIISLIRVWGNGSLNITEDKGRRSVGNVDERIFKEFNLPIVGKESLVKDKSSANLSEDLHKTGKNIDKVIDDSETKSEEPKETELIDRKQREYEIYSNRLDAWRNGSDLNDHAFYRSEIARFYSRYLNWEEEGIPKYIIDQVDSLALVEIEGQKVSLKKQALVLERSDENYYFLRSILDWKYKGSGSWDFPNSNRSLLFVTSKILKGKEKILKSIRTVDINSWNYGDILILNSIYLNLINNNFSYDEFSVEDIYHKVFRSYDDLIKDGRDKEIYLNQDWKDLKAIYNSSADFKQNQENLLKYFEYPQGDTRAKGDEGAFIDGATAIKSIKKLKDNNFILDQNLIGSEEYKSDKYMSLYKKEVLDKLPTLLKSVTNYLDHTLDRLSAFYEGDISYEKIEMVGKQILEYLSAINKTSFPISSQVPEYLYKEDLPQRIMAAYNNVRELRNLDGIEKLVYFKDSNLSILNEYIEDLEKLVLDLDNNLKNINRELVKLEENNREFNETKKDVDDLISKTQDKIDILLGGIV